MTLPIGLQLYSVREQLTSHFYETLDTVAAMGYAGVELGAMPNHPVKDVATHMRSLHLNVLGMHTGVLNSGELKRSLDEAAEYGCTRIVMPWIQPDTFNTLEGVHRLADELNTANQMIQQRGMTLFYHNHDFEMRLLNGRPALFTLIERLEPSVQLEIDGYWVVVGGQDLAGLLATLGSRVGLLHVKDGHVDPASPMLAVGDGKVDYTQIIPSLPSSVAWLVVELDLCATDMLEAVRRSIIYLTEKGLGRAREA